MQAAWLTRASWEGFFSQRVFVCVRSPDCVSAAGTEVGQMCRKHWEALRGSRAVPPLYGAPKTPTPPHPPAFPRPVRLLPIYQRLYLRVRQMYKWYKQYQTLIGVIDQGRYVYISFVHPSKAADTEVRVIRLAELVEKSSGQNLQMDGWISKGRRDQRKRGGGGGGRYLSKPCPMQMKTHWMKDTPEMRERACEISPLCHCSPQRWWRCYTVETHFTAAHSMTNSSEESVALPVHMFLQTPKLCSVIPTCATRVQTNKMCTGGGEAVRCSREEVLVRFLSKCPTRGNGDWCI